MDWLWCATVSASVAGALVGRLRVVLRLVPEREAEAVSDGERMGMAALLAGVCARLRGGGSMLEALERYADGPFATRAVTRDRVRALLYRVRMRDETESQVEAVAFGVVAACRLSETSGCEAARCLAVVAEDYRRLRMAEDLRRNAFAMPLATVKLLSALPLLTVVMGMALGADPLLFLFGSAGGTVCGAVGMACYVAGMVWLRVLLNDKEPER